MIVSLITFLVSAIAIWIAGIWITRSVDAIDTHFKLGSAFGGLILLGISGSLPELAITITGAMHHDYGMVIGNLLGGIAIQTVVLVILDFSMKTKQSLSFAAASLLLVLEANVVILVTVIAIIASETPMMIPHTNISLSSLAILVVWILGLWLTYKSRKNLPWKSVVAPEATPGRTHEERQAVINHPHFQNKSWAYSLFIFLITSVIILIAGVKLEESGNFLANYFGIATGLFAATFISLATALPEISTGIASIKMKDYRLAVSDIFGSNAFMPALFVIADIVAGKQVLSFATPTDIWFAALGILLTGIYGVGLLMRPKKLFFRVGIDSLLVLSIYIISVLALYLNH
jgi:cation:H+ antiporter